MIAERDIRRAAEILGRCRLDRRPVQALPVDCRPRDEAEGYAVQDALHAWQEAAGLGGLVGYKIGCTNRAMQALMGVDIPCAGGMLAANLHDGEAAFQLSRFVRVGVECEIGMRMATDVPADGAPYTGDAIAEHVAACMAAAEIVDDRYVDFRALGVPNLIADDFFAAAAVVGDEVAAWRDVDLASLTGTTRVNGAEAGRGRGADVMGHPLEALAWLANTLAGRGRSLKSGDLVLTGSMVLVQWIDGPADVEISVAGLGEVRVRFDEG